MRLSTIRVGTLMSPNAATARVMEDPRTRRHPPAVPPLTAEPLKTPHRRQGEGLRGDRDQRAQGPGNGSYDVLGTKDGANVFYDVSADLQTFTLNTHAAGK
jgi:hypothetical protein